jgi:thiosulfate/3-mercaptopyruvate sulfurtransferase
MPIYTNLISASELANLLGHCTVLDCRAKLGDFDWGKAAFEEGHIATAQHADLDRDLAAEPGLHGRHPLPDQRQWLDTVRGWGITAEQQVVLYDDAGGPYAARGWWMLRWLGLEAVAVLNGGLQQWSGELVSHQERPANPSDYTPGPALTKLITVEELLQAVNSTPPALIDARAYPRWAGAEEPIDAIAGHIPGASCYPFADNLDEQGLFKSVEDLRQRFSTLAQTEAEVVSYCGSGVTAAHNLLAMHIAGLPEATLFADSWSGWITDPARPIATVS